MDTFAPSPGVLARLTDLKKELDGGCNNYTPKRIWAALRALGLEPKDVDPNVLAMSIRHMELGPDVPPERVQQIKEQREDVQQSLRLSRIEALKNKLQQMERMDDIQLHRWAPKFETGLARGSAKPPNRTDIFPPEAERQFDSGETEEERQRRQKIEAAREQHVKRKADQVAIGFLEEQKRQAEAEKKMKDLDQRLREREKEKAQEIERRRQEYKKKTQAREDEAQKIALAREEHCEEAEKAMLARMEKAAQARLAEQAWEARKEKHASEAKRKTATGSTMSLDEHQANAEQKRQEIYEFQRQREAALLNELEYKQRNAEERLEERRAQIMEEMSIRAEQTKEKHQQKQIEVYKMKLAQAEERQKKHEDFEEKFKAARKQYKDSIKEKSKSTSELLKKRKERWQAGAEKKAQEMTSFHDDLNSRYERAAANKAATEKLGLKCGMDIHSFREVKKGTWGELQKARHEEYKRSVDAQVQRTLLEVAGFSQLAAAKAATYDESERRRREFRRLTLLKNDTAHEAFVKMKAQTDENKITAVMEGLGFKMPKLDVHEEEEPEEKKPAF